MSNLDAILIAGGATWPAFRLTLADLRGYAATTALDHSALQNAADVVLVCASLKGIKTAVTTLDRTIRANVPIFLARIDRNPEFVNDICQELQERLHSGAPPRLATYSGSGPLINWLRVMTVRLALDAKRAQPSLSSILAESFADRALPEHAGPDLQVLKARYGQSLLDAVSGGLLALPRRQRAVLRLYLLANLSSEEIGRIYAVHRATVARWIATAERSIFDFVRAEFRQRWGLETGDVTSLVGLIRSQLPLSLETVL